MNTFLAVLQAVLEVTHYKLRELRNQITFFQVTSKVMHFKFTTKYLTF